MSDDSQFAREADEWEARAHAAEVKLAAIGALEISYLPDGPEDGQFNPGFTAAIDAERVRAILDAYAVTDEERAAPAAIGRRKEEAEP